MEILEIRELISQDWRTDDYIRKQLLCNKLRYCNDFQRRFILDYNMTDYDGVAEEKYIKDDKENIIRLKTYLNKNIELVDLSQKQCEIDFDIDPAREEISCKLKYFYHRDANNQELRRKKAIVLETFSYEEFRNLVMYVGYDDFENYVEYRNYFIEVFKSHFLKAKTAEELKFLYTHTPEFVLKGMTLEDETVFGHLLALTKLDDTGKFSGWSDGSCALVNVLKAFSNHIFLLNKFKDNPELCNRIYFNLDGISEMNGEMKSNRIIFATILMEYCMFSHNRPKAGVQTFRIGKAYKVNTDLTELSGPILVFGQSDEKTFFLQQQKEVLQTAKVIPKEGDPNALKLITADLEEGKQYFPLEMVYFIDENKSGVRNEETGQEEGTVVMMVPAIYVKALADAENLEDINGTIRIVADMVGVVLGIGTLALSGNPYVLLAAAADLSLALPDLTIQAFREEIAKLEGGEEFLRQWDLIYNTGGAIVAAPQLVVGFYRACLSLMKLPQTAEKVRQGLRAMAISVFLDLNSGVFQRKDLRLFQPTEWIIPSAGFFSKTSECDALVQNGAFFMELDAAAIMESINKGNGINPDVIGTINSNRRFALIYKGEIVAQGSRYDKAYQKVLQDLKKVSYSSEKVTEILEILWRRIPRLTENKFYWTCVNEAGTELKWANVTEKDIQKTLNSALTSSNGGKLWEGEVAKELSNYDKITDAGNEFEIIRNGKRFNFAGDIDVGSSKYIIECKESVSRNIKLSDFLKQFDKYLNPQNEKYINIKNRKVVLAIKKFGDGINVSHPVFRELKKRGVIVITDLNQIKKLK